MWSGMEVVGRGDEAARGWEVCHGEMNLMFVAPFIVPEMDSWPR